MESTESWLTKQHTWCLAQRHAIRNVKQSASEKGPLRLKSDLWFHLRPVSDQLQIARICPTMYMWGWNLYMKGHLLPWLQSQHNTFSWAKPGKSESPEFLPLKSCNSGQVEATTMEKHKLGRHKQKRKKPQKNLKPCLMGRGPPAIFFASVQSPMGGSIILS